MLKNFLINWFPCLSYLLPSPNHSLSSHQLISAPHHNTWLIAPVYDEMLDGDMDKYKNVFWILSSERSIYIDFTFEGNNRWKGKQPQINNVENVLEVYDKSPVLDFIPSLRLLSGKSIFTRSYNIHSLSYCKDCEIHLNVYDRLKNMKLLELNKFVTIHAAAIYFNKIHDASEVQLQFKKYTDNEDEDEDY